MMSAQTAEKERVIFVVVDRLNSLLADYCALSCSSEGMSCSSFRLLNDFWCVSSFFLLIQRFIGRKTVTNEQRNTIQFVNGQAYDEKGT